MLAGHVPVHRCCYFSPDVHILWGGDEESATTFVLVGSDVAVGFDAGGVKRDGDLGLGGCGVVV